MTARTRKRWYLLASSSLVAIGVGASAAMFTVWQSLTPAGLPYPAAERLVVPQAGGRSWSPAMLESVRAAMTFALHKQGYRNYLSRLIDFMDHPQSAAQVQRYLIELGPEVVQAVTPRLQEPDEGVRQHLATVLGALGNESTLPVLTRLKDDPDTQVASAAAHAVERIKMTQK